MNATCKAVGLVCALTAAAACGGEAPQTPREIWVENHAQAEKATGKERKHLLNFLDHLAFRLPAPSP